MSKPRVRVINHYARDSEREGGSALTIPWEKRQALNDALAHVKRLSGVVPSTVTTANQVEAVKRSVGSLRVEIDAVMKLLMEK